MENSKKKPKAKIIGQNANTLNLLGIASRALKSAGQEEESKEMTKRVFACGSYEEALNIIQEYIEAE